MSKKRLKSPYVFPGGKGSVADLVWEKFGNVKNYIEPFLGSGAVLLRRPLSHFEGVKYRVETVNDVNHYIVNFWRSVIDDPRVVAQYADYPVTEADLHSRHRWLVQSRESVEFRRLIETDPKYHDPPCTYLCSSGLHWNKRVPGRDKKTEEALQFVRTLLAAPIPMICMENPVGRINTAIRKPSQKVQPWMFGEDASKGTCLWLVGLEKLQATKIVPPKGWEPVRYAFEMTQCECCEEPFCELHGDHFADCPCIGPHEDEAHYRTIDGFEFATRGDPIHPVWANQTPSGQNKLGPSETRWMERSKTYPGIAEAMAEQWGNPDGRQGNHLFA